MKDTQLVSILIPCYNVEKFLPECLDSVLSQTYRNLQIVMIDDGSSDSTWGIMLEYASKDSRIEVYHQDNNGVAITRNNLLDKVKGDYVLFVDSDDWIDIDMVEYLVSKAIETNSSIVACSMVINGHKFDGNIINDKIWEQAEAIYEFLRHETFKGSLCNKLVSTNLLQNVRFHNGISYGEDALFCWGLLQHANRVLISDKVLYHYRINLDSISHQIFGEKKLTGHETWRIITEEVAINWPEYLCISQARWGLEDFYILREASQTCYPYSFRIKDLQNTIISSIKAIKKTNLTDKKNILSMSILSRWYGFGWFYYKLHKIKKYLNEYINKCF